MNVKSTTKPNKKGKNPKRDAEEIVKFKYSNVVLTSK